MGKRIAGFLGVLASIAGILGLLVALNIIHPFGGLPPPPTPIPGVTVTNIPTETPTITPTPLSPTPTQHHILLGSVDLNRYCQSLGDVRASLDGSTAYDWHCVTQLGNHVSIDVVKACQLEYNRSDATAKASDLNNPNSWSCYAPS